MNGYRLVGDSFHLLAIFILLIRIYRTANCAGISGRTQILYTFVFVARYVDLMTNFVSLYNSVMKIFFITSSFLTLYLIYIRFRQTYEAKSDTFRFEFLILIAAGLALLYNHEFSTMEILWTFSIYLEAMAIIPQLYMFHNTKDVSMFPGHYIFALGSYRAFYIVNWIYRYNMEEYYDPIAIGAGVIQTLLYLDFFYMYLTNRHDMRGAEKLVTVVV